MQDLVPELAKVLKPSHLLHQTLRTVFKNKYDWDMGVEEYKKELSASNEEEACRQWLKRCCEQRDRIRVESYLKANFYKWHKTLKDKTVVEALPPETSPAFQDQSK